MLGEIRGEVRFKEPLSFHTSLRIGGAADIIALMELTRDRVHAQFGVVLETEIRILGE